MSKVPQESALTYNLYSQTPRKTRAAFMSKYATVLTSVKYNGLLWQESD